VSLSRDLEGALYKFRLIDWLIEVLIHIKAMSSSIRGVNKYPGKMEISTVTF